jgi:predicted nucleic acid-binding protein
VFLYARGSDHPYREPCRRLLDAVGRGRLRLDASTELIQEFLHVLLRRGISRDQALEEAGEVRRLCRVTAFDNQVLTMALTMIRKYPGLGVRDAVHAATAVVAGIDKILSADQVFDGLDELERVDPLDSLELLKL